MINFFIRTKRKKNNLKSHQLKSFLFSNIVISILALKGSLTLLSKKYIDIIEV